MTIPVTKNLRDGVITIYDGTSYTPNELEVIIEEGNLTFKEEKTVVEVKDRGALSHLRPGEEISVKGSFSIKFRQFLQQEGATDPSVYEALTKTGGASAWVSTNTDGGGVYTVGIRFEIATPTSGEKAEKITFDPVFIPGIDFKEGDESNELSFEFTAFQTKPTKVKYEV